MNTIKSVGIELEGGYCPKCVNPILDEYWRLLHIDMGSDGSVKVYYRCKEHGDIGTTNSDECHGEIRAWTDAKHLNQLFNFMQKLYASGGFKQNRTCGNHIHIKFKNKEAWKTFTFEDKWKEFINRYVTSFKMKKYSNRLNCRYCSSRWDGRPPIPISWDTSRYSMINFQSLIERQKTLEFRILPYFANAKEAQRSCQTMLDIIDDMVANRP